MADAGFRIVAQNHPDLARTLRARIAKRQAELAAQVSTGYATDWADYNKRTGIIAGLKEAIDLCEQAEKDLEN